VACAVVLSLSAIVGACGETPPPSPSARPPRSALPAASLRPSVRPLATILPTTPAAAASDAAIAVDESLLDVLPETVGGLDLTFSADAAASVAGDADLARQADAVAYAVASDASSSDLLVASVSHLRDATFSEPFFRDWRDSFDAAVCDRAGGVVGHAEATIENRTVFIGSCAGGGNTYHVWLPGRESVVSAFSVGDRRLGEKLAAGLRDAPGP